MTICRPTTGGGVVVRSLAPAHLPTRLEKSFILNTNAISILVNTFHKKYSSAAWRGSVNFSKCPTHAHALICNFQTGTLKKTMLNYGSSLAQTKQCMPLKNSEQPKTDLCNIITKFILN